MIVTMDIIDLCDDEETPKMLAPEDPLQNNEDEGSMNNDLADSSIQIVDVQSLSTSDSTPDTDKDEQVIPAKRSSRRKTVHQPINDNDQAEFTYINEENNDDEFIDVSELAKKKPLSFLEAGGSDIIDIMDRIKKAPNANADLLKRVAFLRISVQFTLHELGFKTFTLNRHCSLQHLKSQYLKEKKLRQTKKR